MYTFVGNLMEWMDRRAVAYTTDLNGDYDVLFTNSWVIAPRTVRHVKRHRPDVRVVHRVDGAATDYGGNPESDRVQARVNLLADATVFQSHYSRYSTREKFRLIIHDGGVIYNPVNVSQFTPAGTRRDLPSGRPLVASASWSLNRGKGTWQIQQLAKSHPEVVFVLCGRFDLTDPPENIVQLGHLSRAQIAEALRSCDVFLNLSENDPCPNVVLEALASGLPVLYRDSGGVPELVGDCGLAVTLESFKPCLDRLLADTSLAAKARARAEREFAPDVIFPKYLESFADARREPLPSKFQVLRLASEGYPVLPKMRTVGDLARAIERRMHTVVRRFSSVGRPRDLVQVGWITYDSFPRRKRRLSRLDPFTGMRVGNVARWMNEHHQDAILNELYVPGRRYDAVVFQKMMNRRCQDEAQAIQVRGGKVIFDANVNYYETWGDYFIPGTEPTAQQREDAIQMTRMADRVVADSTYLRDEIARLNPRVQRIADNVNMAVYGCTIRRHGPGNPVRLVWSGVAKRPRTSCSSKTCSLICRGSSSSWLSMSRRSASRNCGARTMCGPTRWPRGGSAASRCSSTAPVFRTVFFMRSTAAAGRSVRG